MADAVSAVGGEYGVWQDAVGAAWGSARRLIHKIFSHQFIQHDAGGDADIEGVSAAGHGEFYQGVAEVLRFRRESFSFVADEEGDGVVWREIGPQSLRAGREAHE